MPMKSQIVYEGVNFESVSELARHLKMRPSKLHTLIAKGLPQDQWDVKSFSNSNTKGKEIIYKKKKYPSIRSLAKEIGISESALRRKIINGRPEDEWNIRDNSQEIFYRGKKYLSISDLSRHLKVNQTALNIKIKKGLPEEEWENISKGEQINFEGIKYDSIQDLADHLNMNYSKLYSRIKKGLPEEEWAKDNQIKINYQDKSFNTIISFAKYLGIPGRTNKLRNLLKSEKDINIVVKKALINEKEEIYFYKDQKFKSFSSLVDFLGFNSRKQTFKKLLTKNNDIEETINIMKKTERKVSIEYGGETFKSYKSLAEKLNVSVNNLRYKIQNGFPKNEWGIEKKIKKIIKYKDKSFNSLSSFSKFLGIPENVLQWRMEYLSEDKWDTKQNFEIESKIEFEGKVFASLNSIVKFLNIPSFKKNKFADLINNGILIKEALRIIKKDHRKIVNIKYKGNEYRLSSLAKLLKINSSTLMSRIESNWPENRWGEKLNNYNITYKGKVFASKAQLAKHLKVSKSVLEKRIKKNWPEEKWGDEQNNYEISYEGKIYKSINDLAKHLKIKSSTLAQRIRDGLPEEEWGAELQNYEISYKGKIYKSINELAKHIGINPFTLGKRIRDGLPEEEWGEVRTRTLISTGYTWDEAPIHLKEAAEKLAIGLNISALEAYKLILEKMYQ